MLDDSLNQKIFLLWAPVLALFDVEILQIELTVVVANIATAEIFAHLDNILLLLCSHDVVAGLPDFFLEVHGGALRGLL